MKQSIYGCQVWSHCYKVAEQGACSSIAVYLLHVSMPATGL